MPLSFSDISHAAKRLSLPPCAVKAVVDVESSGSGFLADGRPVIRFEKHIFLRELKKRGASADAIARAGALSGVRWETLNAAIAIHEEAALASASWGLFQIMGFNHRSCGFADVHAFVAAMKESEIRQLDAFCTFMINEGLVLLLKGQDWTGFARRYNGPGYAENNYDNKIRRAFERCCREMRQ
ncbi:N-acetylmuramidase family protein [Desulfovibrio sp. OttesenSCG-928-A18]|nr:N-acetylmuramidase family protein [Desulfovibrio sp. OttesenSCG-928-A18]